MNRRSRHAEAGFRNVGGPGILGAGFWRLQFSDGALPLGLKIVALGTTTVDTLGGKFWWRHGRVFRKLAFLFEEGGYFGFDFLFGFGVEQPFVAQEFVIKRDWVALLPVFAFVGGNILGGVVLGMAAATKRFDLDKDGTVTGTRAIDSFLGCGVDGDDIVAIDDVTGYAYALARSARFSMGTWRRTGVE